MSINMIFDHLLIVLLSVIFTMIVGIPLGALAYLNTTARAILLRLVDLLQTIPALALLGVIMVFLGPGKLTVIAGLVLYSLLPVTQNTYLGLSNVDSGIKEAARGMGMTRFYRLVRLEFPLAFPIIFTGIRIATVTSIGVAVFASFVGGGGLGAVIYRGIHIQNMKLILSGTLSLMAMAILFDAGMALVERRLQQGERNGKRSVHEEK